ncbi:hypothetical protein D9611_012943 [Ephemerocybe angulata]|uniref:Uncharacterized protein n=1 Tax=Ephemerocybe angulata TaxID=980116 RepID=A0A8H5C6D3_9AGAR|nr:hypothetical protein D9611_012943 [Tulosesus angulatus]
MVPASFETSKKARQPAQKELRYLQPSRAQASSRTRRCSLKVASNDGNNPASTKPLESVTVTPHNRKALLTLLIVHHTHPNSHYPSIHPQSHSQSSYPTTSKSSSPPHTTSRTLEPPKNQSALHTIAHTEQTEPDSPPHRIIPSSTELNDEVVQHNDDQSISTTKTVGKRKMGWNLGNKQTVFSALSRWHLGY